MMLSILSVLLLVHGVLCNDMGYITSANNQSGTTPYLQEIFTGRCRDLQHVIRPDLFVDSQRNCTELWNYFAEAFSYKEPCNVTADDYMQFAETATHDIPPNESLLWEKVYPFANEFAAIGKRYTTLAGTLNGFLTNGITWCGQLEDPGINYDNCPSANECDSVNGQLAVDEFWLMTSEVFSEQTMGSCSVMMNGSDVLPFDPNSVFATRELVNLTPEKGVTDMNIMVLHDLGGVAYESCGEGSILQLQNQAVAQGLTVTCENNPEQVRLFQCVDDPDAPECELTSSVNV